MKKEYKNEEYVSPSIETIHVEVELGFCESYGENEKAEPWCSPSNSPWKKL